MTARTFTEGTNVIRSKIIKEHRQGIDVLTLTVSPAQTIEVGDVITLVDIFANTVFKGIVQDIQIGGVKTAKIYDYGVQLMDLNLNTIYNSQSPEAIITDIVDNNTGMTYTSSISSGTTIDKWVIKDKRAWDVIVELSEILNANFRVDKDLNFHLELRGENNSSQSLTSSSDAIKGEWKQDSSQMVNSIILIGDNQVFEKTQLFSGDGSTTEFTLNEIPIDVKVEHPVGTELDGFVQDFGTGDFQVDRENKKIIFDTAPASGSNNIKVFYTYSVPIKVSATNPTSIATYGKKSKRINKPYINSFDEARSFANYYLEIYSEPLLSSQWILGDPQNWGSYTPNEIINVVDGIRSVTGDFIIEKIERTYPGTVVVSIGEQQDDLFNWQKETQFRVKQLEERDDNSDIIQEYQNLLQNIEVLLQVRITSFKQRNKGTCFYLNDDDNGLLRETATPYSITLCEEDTGEDWEGLQASTFPSTLPWILG